MATSASARGALTQDSVDIALLDSAMAETDRKEFFNAVRATRHPPAIILLAPTADEARELAAIGIADVIAVKPARLPDAKRKGQRRAESVRKALRSAGLSPISPIGGVRRG
ncbi:MAG TPA: hypothetical protein VHT52_00620 [Stellaceae bacterium]|nr:hypothetical protein [Stellaceae bacterium]